MEMEKRLYDAAIEGSASTLNSLIQQDPLILERITSLTSFHETPLHVSVLRGDLEFTRALLSHNTRIATESDSLGRLPLHVAAAKGHVEITRELLRVGSTACVARDKDGMTPLHVAVAKGGGRGRVEVVRELTRACPESTRLRVEGGESVYHLCVKYNNLETLKALVEELVTENDNINLLDARDDYGNTVFHLAALHKHLEMIKYLYSRPGIDINAMNKNGLTALDLAENSPRDMKGLELLNFLLQSNAKKTNSSSTVPPNNSLASPVSTNSGDNARANTGSRSKSWKRFFTFTDKTHLENLRGELSIVSAIIVAITALPIINMKVNGTILDDEYIVSTWSLVPALSVMILLVSGLPLRNKFCIWLVLQLMYTAIGFLGLNYIGAIISNENRYMNLNETIILMCIWFGLLIMVSLLNMIRLIVLIVTSITGCMKRRRSGTRRDGTLSHV